MDFSIDGLPACLPLSQGKTTVFVAVDHLTDMLIFAHYNIPKLLQSVARVFVENVVKLHGIPQPIVINEDKAFTGTSCNKICHM